MIAHRAYDVKIGWDANCDFDITVDENARKIFVSVSDPRVLSVTGVEPEAIVLHRDEGLVNRLTPEDMAVVMLMLEKGARESSDLAEACKQARDDLKKLITNAFSATGFTSELNFRMATDEGVGPSEDAN